MAINHRYKLVCDLEEGDILLMGNRASRNEMTVDRVSYGMLEGQIKIHCNNETSTIFCADDELVQVKAYID